VPNSKEEFITGEGVQESGVQEFRSSGVQEFRSSGVQEFRSSGVPRHAPREPVTGDR
jgi:hypothetical protein